MNSYQLKWLDSRDVIIDLQEIPNLHIDLYIYYLLQGSFNVVCDYHNMSGHISNNNNNFVLYSTKQ